MLLWKIFTDDWTYSVVYTNNIQNIKFHSPFHLYYSKCTSHIGMQCYFSTCSSTFYGPTVTHKILYSFIHTTTVDNVCITSSRLESLYRNNYKWCAVMPGIINFRIISGDTIRMFVLRWGKHQMILDSWSSKIKIKFSVSAMHDYEMQMEEILRPEFMLPNYIRNHLGCIIVGMQVSIIMA